MKSGTTSHDIPKESLEQISENSRTKTSTDVDAGALEKQFIVNFDRRCTILLSEEERDALYSALGDYRTTRQLNPLLDRLSQIINSPIKMELVDDVRHFVEQRHLSHFDRGMPFSDLSSKVVKILNSTPSYDVRQKSGTTSPISLTPRPMADSGRPNSKDEIGYCKRFELTKVGRQQLGFSLWGTSNGQGDIFIKNVVPHSLADSSGLKPGDRVLDINDISLDSFNLAQVANLVENSVVLRMRVLRNKESQKAISKHQIQNEDQIHNHGRSEDRKRTPNPRMEISHPSAYVSHALFSEDNNRGDLKSTMSGSQSYEANVSNSQNGNMPTNAIRNTMPINDSSNQNANVENVTSNDFLIPLRKTKTVIDLNGKSVTNDFDTIRIEEVSPETDASKLVHNIRSSTLPRIIPSIGGINHQKSRSLQLLPTPQIQGNQTNSFISNTSRNTKVIPIIRSYVPGDDNNQREVMPESRYTSTRHPNQRSYNQPQLNLIPQTYLHQLPTSSTHNTESRQSSTRHFPTQSNSGSRSPRSRGALFQNKNHFEEFQRHVDPVFPMAIPHYHGIPRKTDDHSYLESQFPHPGMWKSIEPISYDLHQKLKSMQKRRYISNPDLSDWYYGRNYNERGSDVDRYSGEYGRNPYTAMRYSGWRSDHDVDYGTSRHYSWHGNTPRAHQGGRYDHVDDAKNTYYENKFKSLEGLNSPGYWDDTDRDYFDFETVSKDFDSSNERKENRINEDDRHYHYHERFSRQPRLRHDPFIYIPPTRKPNSSLYQSHASKEVLFKKGGLIKSKNLKMSTRSNDLTTHLYENESSSARRLRRYDKIENYGKLHRQTTSKKPIRSLTSKSSNDSDLEIKPISTQSRKFESENADILKKSLNKLPKAQPRSHSKTPSISSLSSSFTATITKNSSDYNNLTNDESGIKSEFNKSSRNQNTHSYYKTGGGDFEAAEESEEMNEISLLGYSKLSSPGASLRSTTSNRKNPVYQNKHFSKDPHMMESRVASPSTRSDSQSSMASVKTTKSGHYDFLEATSEFNKNKPRTEKLVYKKTLTTLPLKHPLTTAREKIFGKDYRVEIPVIKNEILENHEKTQETNCIKFSETEENIKTAHETDEATAFKSKSDKNNSMESNTSKWSWEDKEINNNEETGWSGNVVHDGAMRTRNDKSLAIDSGDSGVSVDTNTISSLLKSPVEHVSNRSYDVYKNQSFVTLKNETSKELNFHTDLGVPFHESNVNINSADDMWERGVETKWRPTVKQRTFNERQQTLSTVETLVKPEKLFQIQLDKTCSYLGLSISGGIESRVCPDIIIDNITRDSAADIDGCLKPGMKLISIDGQSLVGTSHAEAVRIIKTSFLDKTQRWMDVQVMP